MRKNWLWVCIIALTLAACTTTETPRAPVVSAPAYRGPVDEIGGAEPRYEPYIPGTLQDYTIKGKTYKIVKHPESFSETGLATWYGEEASGNRTSSGEIFDPNALTAAHPTLPIPSYVRVTNLSNGRRLVVRINDRGPYTPGRIIDLSKAAGDRLNISNNTKVIVEAIVVAPDGTVSGPGTVGTTVAKQSFALPDRPNLGASNVGAPSLETMAPTIPASHPAVSNPPTTNAAATYPASSVSSPQGGFLGAPSRLRAGVLETSTAPSATATIPATAPVSTPLAASSIATSPVARSQVNSVPAAASSGGRYLLQVGALSDQQRAQTWLRTLSARFNVTGKVTPSNGLYRVQLGPFQNRQQASELQQRLASEAQQQSFVTAADAR